MKQLDQYEKWNPRFSDLAHKFLNDMELKEYLSINPETISSQLKDLLEKPIANFTVVNEVYFRARWSQIMEILHPENDLTLLEIASGDADMIVQAMARTYENGKYITANMNKLLSKSLIHKTKDLPIAVQIIEDDAISIDQYLGIESVDMIAFQHAVNDVLQAILCDQEGIDTIYSDWMETLPRMIEILQKVTIDNNLEARVKIPFLSLLNSMQKVLKKGGMMVMNHYMFQLDLDWGYPPYLFEFLIPIVREWVKEIPEIKEVYYDGFDQNWWMFLEKI
ncbi:MAG: hypothetical protein K0S47_1243 [Herbinix sp.]|jgi:ubiquinone/menaquinone biosynthesis C-methylase UbiE|nr:hypothetical protein [Herbinix sp.]